ncbi:MAG: hypothetical protein ABI418_00975 [Jatrophihabitantaceae bacterium]
MLYEASGDLIGLDKGQVSTVRSPIGYGSLIITAANCDTAVLAESGTGRLLTYDMSTCRWR